ncbi:MAG: NUDIX domain-containing protein [Patescibacteria group bacterium]|jgi:8-oxo-dGTP diphosphatase
MNLGNSKYQNQYLHADAAVFTVEDRKVKLLLVRRSRKPYIGQWSLPGGGIYRTESAKQAIKRELAYKTGLKNLYLEEFGVFSEPKRDPRGRIISIAFLALLDKNKVSLLQKTPKTMGAKWFDIKKLPPIKWDHKKITNLAIAKLRKRLLESNIACRLLPRYFTLPELHKTYEIILGKQLDRRNFRKKFLKLGLIIKTENKERGSRNRPAAYYKFKTEQHQDISIF